MELIGIAVRDTNASRHWNADPSLYTTDAESLIDAADVVIELTGGIEDVYKRQVLGCSPEGARRIVSRRAWLVPKRQAPP